MKKQILIPFLFFITFLKLQSQIAGSFTVPGSFPTLAAAINTLNLTGVAGAVTINVMAGHTETVPVGGLTLLSPPGSFTTTIVFKKLGTGSNPLLLAYAGGTATPFSAKRDGIWMFAGCRNITVDAIDILDQNTTSPATMEFGYGFYKTLTAGCVNNTIRNCAITLASPNSDNSFGIELSVSHYSINTLSVAPTSTLMTNSLNTFHNNIIKKCDAGIFILGNTSNNFYDIGNDVGGISAVTGNTVVNFGGGSWNANGIYADYQFKFNASYNIINNNNGTGSPAFVGARGIFVRGANATTINSNTISLMTIENSNSPLVGISQNGFVTGTVTINNNIFLSLSSTAGFGAPSNSIISSDDNDLAYLNNNQIGNFTASSGTLNIISTTGSNTVFINNNTISGATISTQGWITGISSTSNYPRINNNILGNFLASSLSPLNYSQVFGINATAGWGLSVTGNTITNLYGCVLRGISLNSPVSAPTYSVANNRIMNFATDLTNNIGSTSIGILAALSSTNTGTTTIVSNTVSNLIGSNIVTSTQGGEIHGIAVSKGATNYVSRNKIYDLSSDGTYGVFGITMEGAQNFIYNNLVGGLNISSSGNINALKLDAAGTSRVHFNSLYLNTSTSTNPNGTNLISSVNSSILELRNNILVNSSTSPSVSAILIANNVSTASNNNAFYFGTNGRISQTQPSTSLIAAYQSIYNSDAQSFIENPNFVSTTGSNTNFLNINTSIPTQIESGAVAIFSITTDYINTTRSSVPDVGAWEGNYTVADAAFPLVANSGFTGPPCNGSSRTFTANLTDVSGVASGSLAPRLYHRVNFGLYTSTQGTLTSGTTTNGVWTFALNYSAVTNDVIWHFLVVQDISYLNNIQIIPATNAVVTDVNTVNVPPNPANNYTIQTAPTISLVTTNTTICAGQPFIIQALGASSYTYLPGNFAIVSPTVNTTYTITGSSSLGCPSTNTLTLNITTTPLPTITVNSGSICAGQSFTMLPNGASTYTYQGGSAVVSPAGTTSYTVAGTSTSGCTSSGSAIVTVVAPALTVTAVEDTVCAGEPITVSASGAINYTWQPGPQSGSTYTNILNTSITLTVEGSDANGCRSTTNIFLVAESCTGLPELKNDLLKLWPNPTSGNLYITQDGTINELLITVKDITGRTITQQTLALALSQINLSAYADGVYVVEIFANDILVARSKLILAQQ